MLSAFGSIMVIIILCSEHNKWGCSFMASESLALLVEPVKATRKIFLLGRMYSYVNNLFLGGLVYG